MVLLTLHGWGFWAVWLWEGEPTRALIWDPYGTNMLAGAISWVCGAALWVTATAYVRRNYFEVWRQTPACMSACSAMPDGSTGLLAKQEGDQFQLTWYLSRHAQVFYRTHILGFVGFILFGYMHYTSLWAFVTPGVFFLCPHNAVCTCFGLFY